MTELDDLLAAWRQYIAKQMHKTVEDCSPGFLAALTVCADQLESILRRMKDDD